MGLYGLDFRQIWVPRRLIGLLELESGAQAEAGSEHPKERL